MDAPSTRRADAAAARICWNAVATTYLAGVLAGTTFAVYLVYSNYGMGV